jgi:hypothetical protein
VTPGRDDPQVVAFGIFHWRCSGHLGEGAMYYDRALSRFVRVFVVATAVVAILAIVMNFDRALFVRVFVVATLAIGLIPVWKQLGTGKVRLSYWPGRIYTRENEPVRYWMGITWGLILEGIMVWLVISLFTSNVTF